MILEIRDYHYRPDRVDDYRVWAEQAVDFFGDRWDLVGWWMDSGEEPLLMGEDPMDLRHGLANITWMLRWDDREQREAEWAALREDPEWMKLRDQHPGFDGYHQMAVRFMEEVGA